LNPAYPPSGHTSPSDFSSSQSVNIDIKRVAYQATRFWYIVVFSLLIALTVSYLSNRYAVRIYPVTASILIKEAQETSEGKFVYNNPLVSGFRNYLNELYIIKSYPLIERTISDLGFETSFSRVGNLLTTEVYPHLPVSVEVLNKNKAGRQQFYFEIVNEFQFKLTTVIDDDSEKVSTVFAFNDTITFQHVRGIFRLTSTTNLKQFSNDPLLFNFTPARSLAGMYVGKLSATWAEEGAGVINLSVNGPNAKKDMDFLSGLIVQYQAYDLDKKNQVALRSIDFISDQLTGITDSLRKAENQLQQFKNRNTISDLSTEASRLFQKTETLEVQKTELIIRSKYYNYLTGYVANGKGLDQVILPTSVGIEDGILSKLIGDMIDLQTQIKMQIGKENSQNPFVLERLKLINEFRKDIVESVRNQKSIDDIKLDFLNKGIGEVEKQLSYLPLAERQLVSIKRNYGLLENLYIFLLQKKAEAGISKASTTSDISIVNPPMIAGGAISPNPSRNYILAVLFGLGLPFLTFILFELLNTRIQSREDIQKLTSMPFIGGIGHKKGHLNLEVLGSPKSAIAESFRALRSNLNYFTGGKAKGVYMISSSISGEGKTFTSVNLASVLALSGAKVLIVGADLRKPKLYNDFGLSNEKGLSSYLSGMLDFDAVVQQTAYDHLDLVSGGPVPPNPSELLLKPRMSEFMTLARERYDFVVLDTPPLGIVTDAFTLAGYADHTLFLVRQNYTPKVLLKNIEDYYGTGKLKNISMVFNDISRSGPGYGYGYEGYGYGYNYGYSHRYGKSKNGYGYYTE